jgi:phosphocarrier protein HPr
MKRIKGSERKGVSVSSVSILGDCSDKGSSSPGDSGITAGYFMPKVVRNIIVQNSLGLHARPAMQFVDTANQFVSNISVVKGGADPGEADGKSVMQMIILAAEQGTELSVAAEGEDAAAAVAALAKLFDDKFGEE